MDDHEFAAPDLAREPEGDAKPFRVLCLDGGGAKGFYTLGVLYELEAMLKQPLHTQFDLVYGTSTGSIIASLIALGTPVKTILGLYEKYVPQVMSQKGARERTAQLKTLAEAVFGQKMFKDVKMGIGVVAARWQTERPMIFKASVAQAHGRRETFVPGFGVRIASAVQASCSAYPFFERTTVTISSGESVELLDGGYCANNPTLYAIADAVSAYQIPKSQIRVLSLGVGVYPEPKPGFWMGLAKRHLVSVELLQKTLEINTQSMDQLRKVLFPDIATLRISDVFERPEMATDLLEHDMKKLHQLKVRGAESYGNNEAALRAFF